MVRTQRGEVTDTKREEFKFITDKYYIAPKKFPGETMAEVVETETRKISATWTGEVTLQGGTLYVSIPKKEAEFWDLRIGDMVQVQIREAKRKHMKRGA